jgi:hypothetical protein
MLACTVLSKGICPVNGVIYRFLSILTSTKWYKMEILISGDERGSRTALEEEAC